MCEFPATAYQHVLGFLRLLMESFFPRKRLTRFAFARLVVNRGPGLVCSIFTVAIPGIGSLLRAKRGTYVPGIFFLVFAAFQEATVVSEHSIISCSSCRPPPPLGAGGRFG